mmetsp:Transcript_38991/g.93844  ORF Transcript_38991/g.93844 Transcript_38991/m.93844 type:complete len:134 (+) Transcript_38991:1781-2182(+)
MEDFRLIVDVPNILREVGGGGINSSVRCRTCQVVVRDLCGTKDATAAAAAGEFFRPATMTTESEIIMTTDNDTDLMGRYRTLCVRWRCGGRSEEEEEDEGRRRRRRRRWGRGGVSIALIADRRRKDGRRRMKQ